MWTKCGRWIFRFDGHSSAAFKVSVVVPRRLQRKKYVLNVIQGKAINKKWSYDFANDDGAGWLFFVR